MLPEKVVRSRTALPSPTTPRIDLRHRAFPASPEPPLKVKSDQIEPLKDVASTSKPADPPSATLTLPECELRS